MEKWIKEHSHLPADEVLLAYNSDFEIAVTSRQLSLIMTKYGWQKKKEWVLDKKTLAEWQEERFVYTGIRKWQKACEHCHGRGLIWVEERDK